MKPYSLSSAFSITRFNFFCLHVSLTRASLLALAKSIYYQKHSVFCFIALPVTRTSPTVCTQKTTSGKCCRIPFKYRGVTFNSCTSADYHRPWCSLDPVYKGRWDNCSKFNLTPLKHDFSVYFKVTLSLYQKHSVFWFIALPVTRTSPTVCPQQTTSGKCCSIPFKYRGVTFNSCTSADYHIPWCSLDPVYKGRWGNCSKFNLTELRHDFSVYFKVTLSLYQKHSVFCFIALPVTRTSPTVCPQQTTSGKCCSIPFKYRGVTFNSCTSADYHRPWCSLDPVYKGRWDNCSKFNLTPLKHDVSVYFKVTLSLYQSILCFVS